MDSMTRQFGLLCLGALAAALAACASNNVSQCEATGILCPSGMHCAAAEPICIADTNLCGDAHKDPLEECDDGNTKDGDGCSHECKIEMCGNGRVDFGEVCDNGPGKNGKCMGCAADCKSFEACGDGVLDTACGEICDDHNTKAGDGCSADCKSTEVCGNGITDAAVGEVCDDGPLNGTTGDKCSKNCRSNLSCNNGIVDPGEECDAGTFDAVGNPHGNDNHNDCRADCQLNRCGDGVIDTQLGSSRHEDCDDGTLNGLIPVPAETPNCNIDCTTPSCGDGKVNRHFTPKDSLGNPAAGPEQCDNGAANNDNSTCTALCQVNVCGDHHTLTGVEACDDGGVDTGNCNANCTKPTCGDGHVNSQFTPTGAPGPEQCDNGTVGVVNQNQDSAACTSTCQINVCGDHHVLAGIEQCDSGGVDTKDCDFDCTLPACGDGHTNTVAGEACDDGKDNGTANSAHGCNQFCQFNLCGNGVVDGSEDCDAGSNGVKKDSAACNSNCTFAKCGDGITNMAAGEACDDGPDNGTAASAHHCNKFCQVDFCGNGILEPGEQCDDGTDRTTGQNRNHAGARCNATCQLNVCGDGDKLEGVEQCDRGGIDTIDCNSDCTLPVCGDKHVNHSTGEECDDGKDNGTPDSANHCDSRCKSNLCGNGVVDINEDCDDGANGVRADSARCNSNCTLARCGDGIINPQFKPDGMTPEVCDNVDPTTHASLNGVPCDYGNPFCVRCNATCTGNVSPGGPFCGDALTQMGAPFNEKCDPATGPSTSSPLDPPSRLARADSATCDIDCTPVICGDGHLNIAALESCDDGNQSACGTCPSTTDTNCRGATPITPTQAHSTVQASAAADDNGILIQPGDNFTLDDGFGQTLTFTFLEQSAGGNTEILFQHAPPDNAGTIASAMAAAIHAQALQGFGIDASVPASPGDPTTVILTNRRKSSLGNTAITPTGLKNFVFGLNGTLNQMDGGRAGNCDPTIGCVSADDCASGVCSGGTCQPCTTDAQCPASTTCKVATGKCH